MSNDLNQCQFIGRAGKDPEMRYLPNGDAVANFSIANGWKSKDKEGVKWVRCTAFGKLAEIIGKYVTKGKQVYVAGRMQTRKWQSKEGQDTYTTEIVVERIQLLGGGSDEAEAPRQAKPAAKAPSDAGFEGMEDDVPF